MPVSPQKDWISRYLQAPHAGVLAITAVFVAAIAILDGLVFPDISVGLLYVIPILAVSFFLRRWQIVLLVLFCTFLREALWLGIDTLPLSLQRVLTDPAEMARSLLIFVTFLVSGLFVSEVSRNRRLIADHLAALEEAAERQRRAEEELGVVVDTSPAAIFITDGSGRILEANASAHQLLESRPGTLTGAAITEFLPALATVPPASSANRALRSNLECRGRRRDGAYFLAQVWLSTYQGAQGPRMAAIVLDASENLRDRGGGGMQSLMMTSRILMGAVSHSVRNLCAAARVAYANLERETTVAGADDFQALGTLIGGLERIAAMELRRTADPTSTVDPNTLLDELRIVIEPGLKDSGIHLDWHVADRLPLVLGEHYGLLHALLNVTQNAQRVLTERPEPRTLNVVTAVRADRLELRITDNGGGVAAPGKLFEPFRTGAGGTGLGLYVARALLRSFEGDLRYEPVAGGSTFIMEMAIAIDLERHAAGNPN